MGYDEVMRLCLERGFLAPSCEIYSDAQAGFWEYGPLGVSLKNRYMELWRRELVRRDGMHEIDGSQIMAKSVFVASGHLESFSDPIVSCKKCGSIFRADKLLSERLSAPIPERMPNEELDKLMRENGIRCPSCGGELGEVSRFNMMFKLGIGPSETPAYLRPETCQSIFVDFPRFYKVLRGKLPIAFAQYGKSFRNEISPRQGLMRLREFYQAEIEVFFNRNRADDVEKFDEVKDEELVLSDGGDVELTCQQAYSKGYVPNRLIAYYMGLLHSFYRKTGIDVNRSRFRKLPDDEKAFYTDIAFDFEVETSLGWIELVACNYRTDYDLSRHGKLSGVDVRVLDGEERVIPHIFEMSMGVDRSLYCILEHCLKEEGGRKVLKLKPYLAPIQVSVFPLMRRDGLDLKAKEVYDRLKLDFDAFYDESGSIGRRYRRMDEAGTPTCVTIDYQTLKDGTVTLRDRDSMKQARVLIEGLEEELRRLVTFDAISEKV